MMFKNWSQVIPKFEEMSNNTKHKELLNERIPTFFANNFVLKNESDLPLDSFLRLDGWHKGLAFLNGFNLGHYWKVGPQITLYSPKHLFKPYPEVNKLVIFELENFPNNRSIQFVDKSVLNATTPYSLTRFNYPKRHH